MRIVSDQLIAGYPAVEVRDFVKRYSVTGFFAEAAEFDLALRPKAAAVFLNKMVTLGFIRGTDKSNGRKSFEVTSHGQALANASAARPVHRRTAERVLAQFLERVHRVNSTQAYAYRVEAVVLFGSMLTDTERLGDVDVAIRLEPKAIDESAQEQWCAARRITAEAKGRNFYGVLDWAMWPTQEILLQLKARSTSLSLHDFSEVEKMPNVRYRVLLGDSEKVAGLIITGQPV
ncbi:MAG TPA: hypothetical protein VMA34_03480 [Terracidiphilus sp.]|nr:hypothetical protein [Terracidiphilus sp.]